MKDQKNDGERLPLVRDRGKFVKGNREGNRFEKGNTGKPKGARDKKTVVAFEFARDALQLDPGTGKKMTNKELLSYIKSQATKSPRILVLLLDHYLGKPLEHVQQYTDIILNLGKKEKGAITVKESQASLPEDESEESESED